MYDRSIPQCFRITQQIWISVTSGSPSLITPVKI